MKNLLICCSLFLLFLTARAQDQLPCRFTCTTEASPNPKGADYAFALLPDPVDHLLHIRAHACAQPVRVILTGETTLQQGAIRVDQTFTFDFWDLPSGNYQLSIHSPAHKIIRRYRIRKENLKIISSDKSL